MQPQIFLSLIIKERIQIRDHTHHPQISPEACKKETKRRKRDTGKKIAYPFAETFHDIVLFANMSINFGDFLSGLLLRHRRNSGDDGTWWSAMTRSRDARSLHENESFGQTRKEVRAVAVHSHLHTSGGRLFFV